MSTSTSSNGRRVSEREPVLSRETRLDRFGLDAPPKRSRTPEIALGLLLIVAAALGAMWLYSRATSSVEALALGRDVPRGAVLAVDDLVVVEVSTEDRVLMMSRSQASNVVGLTAVADWRAGDLVTPEMFSALPTAETGEAIVGVAVTAGALPVSHLAIGDTVTVVLTPPTDGSAQLEADAVDRTAPVLFEAATVIEVTPLGTVGDQVVSLILPNDDARLVAAASSEGRVRLIKVGRS